MSGTGTCLVVCEGVRLRSLWDLSRSVYRWVKVRGRVSLLIVETRGEQQVSRRQSVILRRNRTNERRQRYGVRTTSTLFLDLGRFATHTFLNIVKGRPTRCPHFFDDPRCTGVSRLTPVTLVSSTLCGVSDSTPTVLALSRHCEGRPSLEL